eukprot:6836072-Alexandrium_andersonii.AAC.1
MATLTKPISQGGWAAVEVGSAVVDGLEGDFGQCRVHDDANAAAMFDDRLARTLRRAGCRKGTPPPEILESLGALSATLRTSRAGA